MRLLNILSAKERKIGSFEYLMNDVSADDLQKSLHYLQGSGYI